MYTDDKVTAYITSKELLFNIESLDELRNLKVNFGRRLESRTRHEDLTDALRFRVHDPLWMLSRQWQLGEFKRRIVGEQEPARFRQREAARFFFNQHDTSRERRLGEYLDGIGR